MALLLGAQKARFIELHMGQALELEELTGDKALAAGCGLYRIGAELKVPINKPVVPPTSRALRGHFAMKDGKASPLRHR